ncbi:hypothetical protein [Legionella hackeliae]|uniref:Uncharacterized protein n=1 Tax=Legionella hackeliae TaxID=449 RepID=A0A0A8UJY8_LEGHA|nr:hypothetical protein [Legionella hackeliae]KTD12837.1 hypothetical protein Lhac_1708 [Legionella hackeliae]CEK09140.1 protein of unknown function [Legionella hackeliae]STX49050.1 Uncharacterised protein [Legionella hackeliae]
MQILILTYAPQKTLGDPSAAAKLQHLLEEFSHPPGEFSVKVVINVQKEDEEPVRNLFPDQTKYEIINGFDRESNLRQLHRNLSACDLIISYPRPNFLSKRMVILLAETLKPVISFTEYDYDIVFRETQKGENIDVVPGSFFLSSGLGDDSLGVFVEQFNHPAEIHPTDLAKLPLDLFSANKELYFGYFNKLFKSMTGATAARFIALAILSSNKRDIDIVLPLQASTNKDTNPESHVTILESSDFIKN